MIFGVVGDIHGNFAALTRILERHPAVPYWLCVGDVASASGAYPTPPAPLYWIKGNNEAFDRIAAFAAHTEAVHNLHYIPNGQAIDVAELRVAGLGGTFAPTWFGTPAAALPAGKASSRAKSRDDKRRHFVREEVEACKRLANVDVLLTHEAPAPFWIDLPSSTAPGKKWRRDVGKAAVTEVADALRPRLHCFGHHHRFAAYTRNGIPTVCVDRVNRSYLLVDAAAWTWTTMTTDDGEEA